MGKGCRLPFDCQAIFLSTTRRHLPEQRAGDIETLRPDLVITGFIWQDLPAIAHYDTSPSHPQVGPQANLALARRWYRLLRAPLTEQWKSDARFAP